MNQQDDISLLDISNNQAAFTDGRQYVLTDVEKHGKVMSYSYYIELAFTLYPRNTDQFLRGVNFAFGEHNVVGIPVSKRKADSNYRTVRISKRARRKVA